MDKRFKITIKCASRNFNTAGLAMVADYERDEMRMEIERNWPDGRTSRAQFESPVFALEHWEEICKEIENS